jgi:hypothetical protein
MNAASILNDGLAAPWRIARGLGLLLTCALLVGLWLQPEASLRILWYAIIPVLPAVFLIHPGLWRNVCPLATLNVLAARRSGARPLSGRAVSMATGIGIVLLVALVPARRFLLNTDGHALAAVIAAVALIAIVAGVLFDRKAGFCNAICPVLPVERLYGHAPLVDVGNAHCATCSQCTTRACIDLSPNKSIAQLLGGARRSTAWMLRPYGVFAAAFPGFVLGYSLLADGALPDAARVYLQVLAGGGVSYLVAAAIVRGLRVPAAAAMTGLAAAAIAIYYWYAASAIASAWQFGTGGVVSLRVTAFLLIGVWLWRRLSPAPARAMAHAIR